MHDEGKIVREQNPPRYHEKKTPKFLPVPRELRRDRDDDEDSEKSAQCPRREAVFARDRKGLKREDRERERERDQVRMVRHDTPSVRDRDRVGGEQEDEEIAIETKRRIDVEIREEDENGEIEDDHGPVKA
jgi:hypothetical protein